MVTTDIKRVCNGGAKIVAPYVAIIICLRTSCTDSGQQLRLVHRSDERCVDALKTFNRRTSGVWRVDNAHSELES